MSRPARPLAIAAVLALAASLALPGCTHATARDARTPSRESSATAAPTSVGTTWTVAHFAGSATPIDIKVKGPWKIAADPRSRFDPHEIVDPSTVPDIGHFSGVTYVEKVAAQGGSVYYPRRVTADVVENLGTVTAQGDSPAVPKPLAAPSVLRPLRMSVGATYTVSDTATGRTEASVLASGTADLPAGKVDDAFLVRFTFTPSAGTPLKRTVSYYVISPRFGVVALFRPTAGNERSGFTAADQIDVLMTLPTAP